MDVRAGLYGKLRAFGDFPEKFSGEGIGYPPQYAWDSLVTQTVKNPPAMQETWVQPLG